MNSNYLSRNNTDCLKGICAIMVVLCHVCARIGIGAGVGLGPIFTAFGYLGVSGFMFMSGFGLTVSLLSSYKNGGGYLSKFLMQRVLPVYSLLFVLSVLYFILKTILAIDTPSLSELVQSFFFGGAVVSFGWYLQCIVLIYLIYYAAAHIAVRYYTNSVSSMLIILVALGLLFFVGLCVLLGLESTWYETTLSFLGGVVLAANRQKLDYIWQVKRNVWLCLLLFVGVFGLSFIFGNGPFLSGAVKILIKMVSSLAFCLCCLSAMRLISLENHVTTFLGRHYLEIYIINSSLVL